MEAVKLNVNLNFDIFELIEYPVIVVNQDQDIIYSNESVSEIFLKDCLHNNLSLLLQLEDGLPLKINRNLLSRTQPIRCLYTNNKLKKYLDVFIKATQDVFVVSFIDVTSYVEREQNLFTQATTDFLTGITNRSRFLFQFSNELKRAERENTDTALLIFDIDYFKLVNDQFGHATGDFVLQKITEVAKKELRDIDIFGRLGGEEFGIVLPGANLPNAKTVADRLRQAIKRAIINLNGNIINITISVGISTAKGKSSHEELMRKADEALYTAKNNGRDTVHCSTSLVIS